MRQICRVLSLLSRTKSSSLSICIALTFLPIAVFAEPVAKNSEATPSLAAIVFHELSYAGKISDNEARFEINLIAESSGKGTASIPVMEGDLALIEPKLPKNLSIEREGNRYTLVVSRPGKYQFKLEMLARIFRSESWNQVAFTGPLAVIGSIAAEAKGEGVELQLLNGTTTETAQTNGVASVKGFLGADPTIALRWQSKNIEVTRKAVVTADTTATALVTPTVIKFTTQYKFEIAQGRLRNLSVELPKSQALTRLVGEQIRDWLVKNEGEKQILSVEFLKPLENTYTLTLFSEQALEGTPTTASLTTPQPIGIERESGSFTLSAEDTLVEIESSAGLRQVNASHGSLAAYRFSSHPFSLSFKSKRIEPMLTAHHRVTTRLEEKRLHILHSFHLNVEKAGIYALELSPQPGLIVSEVRAEGLEDWKISDGKLHLTFATRLLGQRKIEVQLERSFKDFPGAIEVMPLRVVEATRETAQMGAASAPGIRLKTAELVGAREISINKLASRTDELLAFTTDQSDWKIALASEKLEARVVADIFNLVTVGEGLVGGSATIRYGLVNQGVQEFKLTLPAHCKNVEFTGPNIRHKEQMGNTWIISLQDKAWDGYTLVVTYDYQFEPGGATLPIGGIHALGVERETGSIAITTAASLRLNVKSSSDLLRRIDETELAEADKSLITRSVLLAYRYAGNTYELSVEAKRFDQMPVLEAVADRTQLTTVLTDGGELLTQASFMVKNNEKQFQRFQLPKDARFWSCYVNNEPAKPEKDGEWLLVPLPRVENRNQAFAVDIVYAQTKPLLNSAFSKSIQLEAPKTDVPNTYAEWELYAPHQFRLADFGGNMSIARGTTYEWRDAWGKFKDFYAVFFSELIFHQSGLLLGGGIIVGFLVLVISTVRRGSSGFVSAMVVLAVIALLAAISIPNFVKSRQTAQANTCVANLKQLDGAKEQWALENKKSPSDIPTWNDLIGPDKYIRSMPYCPHGGEYVLNNLGNVPICSASHADAPSHVLPDFEHQTQIATAATPQIQTPQQSSPSVQNPIPSGTTSMAAGLRSIRIDIPREGRPFVFTKVLNVLDEPLAIEAGVMKMSTFYAMRVGIQSSALLAGLAIVWWQLRRNYRNSLAMTLGLSLVLGAVISLLIAWRILHIGMILSLPAIVFVLVVKLIWKFRPIKKDKPEIISPEFPGAGPAVAALAFMLFFGMSADAKEATAGRAQVSAPEISNAVSISTATYSGSVNDRVAQFDIVLQVSATEPNQTLPLFGEEVVVQKLSAKPEAKLVRNDKTVGVLLPKKGDYTVEARFLVKLSGDVTKRHLNFHIPPALTSRLALTLDQPEADVEFSSAVSFKKNNTEKQTQIDGVLSGGQVDLCWTPRVKRVDEIVATVFSENATLLTIGNGVINARTTFRFHVTQGELRQMKIAIPKNQRLLRLDGEGIRTWQLKNENDNDFVLVELLKGVSSDYQLSVETEKVLESVPSVAKIEVAHAVDTKRETGLLALRGSEELSLTVESIDGLQRVDAEEFERVTGQKCEAVFNAFRFLKTDFALNVKAESVQPQIEVRARNSIRLSADQVSITANFDYTIKRAGVFSLKFVLPDDYRFDQVSGTNVLQTMERTEGETRILEVTLKERTIGNYSFSIDLFRPLKEVPKTFPIVDVHPLEAEKLTGLVTVSSDLGIVLKVENAEGLTEIPAITDLNRETGSSLAYKFISGEKQADSSWKLVVKTESVEPWLRAEVVNRISVTETLISGNASVRYEIQNAPVKELRLRVPAHFKNVEIAGAHIRRRDQSGEIWKVELQSKVRGAQILTVTWEQPRESGTNLVELVGVNADGVERETGLIAITTKPPLQIMEGVIDALVKMDIREFPEWAGKPDNSTVLAYRYSRPAYKLAVHAKRFDEAEVLQALVENIRLTSVIADDGQAMTELSLSIRNNGRQFLEVELPVGTEVWSAFVAGQPIRPSKREGKLLLPLEKVNASEAIAVQLTYVGTNLFPRGKGEVAMTSPKLDVPLKNARWELYLPPDFDYSQFKGSMTREVSSVAAAKTSFTISEYEQQEAQKRAHAQAEVMLDISSAQDELSKGNYRQAANVFNRAKGKGDWIRNDEAKKLEKSLRQVQASNLINAQSEFSDKNNGTMGGQAGSFVNGSKVQSMTGIYSNEAAEAQWSALEKAQEIAVAKVQPLRVNLPIRGVRHTFSQVLQTDEAKSMTIQFLAVATKNVSWYSKSIPVVAGFIALWALVTWMNMNPKKAV